MNHAAIENPVVHTEHPDCFKEDVDESIDQLAKMIMTSPNHLDELVGDLEHPRRETLFYLIGRVGNDEESAAADLRDFLQVITKKYVVGNLLKGERVI